MNIHVYMAGGLADGNFKILMAQLKLITSFLTENNMSSNPYCGNAGYDKKSEFISWSSCSVFLTGCTAAHLAAAHGNSYCLQSILRHGVVSCLIVTCS